MRWIVLAIVATGCVQSHLVECGDKLCPAATACDVEHATCVSPERLVACDGLVDGDVCEARDRRGICDRGVCVNGCGDGTRDDAEDCDDGNFASHDGCSSDCTLERAEWVEWHSAWSIRAAHSAAYDETRQVLVLFGGVDQTDSNDDLWERDALGTWTQLDIPRPSRRQQAPMIYDVARSRIVLFGGYAEGGPVSDTWEYDGATWTMIPTAHAPSPRTDAKMIYDRDRHVAVLFGGRGAAGHLADTWEYDGIDWIDKTALVGLSPIGRSNHAMAYHQALHKTVLFGGGNSSAVLGDTWTYDGTAWVSIAGTAPSPRLQMAMAYLPSRGKAVLFAGSSASTDTWEFDATGWAPVYPGNQSPPSRVLSTLTMVGAGNSTGALLIGGRDPTKAVLDDLWMYDGSWRQQSPNLSPKPRDGIGLGYDVANESLVTVGGSSTRANTLSWTFDGIKWTEHTPAPAWLQRTDYGIAYDASRQRVVLFGGIEGDANTPFGEVYEWDGAQWTLGAASGPAPRRKPQLAFDPIANRIVMFGGYSPSTIYADLWEYDGTTWTQIDTPTHPGDGTMTYDTSRGAIVLLDTAGQTWTFRDHQWQVLAIPSFPNRVYPMMTFDPRRHRPTMFGGMIGNALTNELCGSSFTRGTASRRARDGPPGSHRWGRVD